MCRLAFIPGNTKISQFRLAQFFGSLEKSFGGDGNGFIAISPKGTTTLRKGVKLSCEEMASETLPLIKQGWAVYFHTRKISIGWSSDKQCHPFRIKGRSFKGSLCHNGTWSEGGVLARYLRTGSDTATFAFLIGQLGLDEIERRKLTPKSGVFMLYGSKPRETKQHRVLHLGGSLHYCPETGIWASEFFPEWPHYDLTYSVKKGAHMLEKPAPREFLQSSVIKSKNFKGQSHFASSFDWDSKAVDYDAETVKDKYALSNYWKEQGYADAMNDNPLDETPTEDENWGGRIFYHN